MLTTNHQPQTFFKQKTSFISQISGSYSIPRKDLFCEILSLEINRLFLSQTGQSLKEDKLLSLSNPGDAAEQAKIDKKTSI